MAAWTPDLLPGLVVWLDAAQLGLADGADVTTWTNIVGVSPSMVGTPLPVFMANLLSGKPVVRFSANQGRLRGNHGLNSDATVVYVVRQWGANVGRAFTSVYDPENYFIGYHPLGQDCMYDDGWVANPVDFGTAPGPWKLYGGDSASVPLVSRFFNDGVLSGTSAPGVGLGMAGTYNLSGYSVTGAEQTMDCDIAELLIYDKQLADAGRAMVEGYLAWKWGLQANLPADHPYKLAAPNLMAAWTPDKLPGLVAHLDAASLGLADGAPLDPWPNLGSGPTPATVGSPAPIVKTNTLNGLPVVRFTVSEGRLRCAWEGGVSDYDLNYVVRRWGTEVGRAFTAPYPPSNMLIGMHSSGTDRMYDNGVWLDAADTAWPDAPPDPWKMYGGNSHLSPTIGARFFINGSLIGSSVTPQIDGGLTGGWNLSGYDTVNSAETSDIDVAELVLYDHQLADADRQMVEGYLAWKWGLQANLPVDHPYKLAAPTIAGRMNVWDGAAWTIKPTKVWMGSAWVEKPMKVWNGGAWV